MKLVSLLQEIQQKKLRIFDFDQTLVNTNNKIYLTNNSKQTTLTPGQFAVYKPKEGDKFDFSDFNQVKEPKFIKAIIKIFDNIQHAGGTPIILTARHNYKPVYEFLKDSGRGNVNVVAVGSSNPIDKANWIESKIKEGYNDILFFDDSLENVKAVANLKIKYPNIKLIARQVKYK